MPLLGCSATADPTPGFRSIEPVCVEDEGAIQEGDWVCGESITVDCHDDAVPEQIVVVLDEGGCDGAQLLALDGPFGPGEHDIDIIDDASGERVCHSELVVTDDRPPDVTTVEVELWPPNHKFHTVRLDDCFSHVDECDEDWDARLLWVTSDEPVNDNGDGNTSEDIVLLGPDGADLRAERQGGRNGRVYTLGFEVEDSSGNIDEGRCLVTVPHDRGTNGAAIDDGPAYRVEAE